jgi:hypothetical protein
MLVSHPDFLGRLASVVETHEADYTFTPHVYSEPSTKGLHGWGFYLKARRNLIRALLGVRQKVTMALLEASQGEA